MRQRLGLAEAIINKPQLLILDEPTNGLDVEGIIEIRNLIKYLSKQGMAILISSHNLNEIDNICNRIIAIKKGKIVADDTIENFKALEGKKSYILELNCLDNIKDVIKNYEFEIISKNKIRVFISKNEVDELMKQLMDNKYQIYTLNEENLTSEEAFIKKVGVNKID